MRLSTGFILTFLGISSQFACGFSLQPRSHTKPFITPSNTNEDTHNKLGIHSGSKLSVTPGNVITMRGGSKFVSALGRAGGGDEISTGRKLANTVASFWGALGVVAILAKSVKRILPIALEPFDGAATPLSTVQLG